MDFFLGRPDLEFLLSFRTRAFERATREQFYLNFLLIVSCDELKADPIMYSDGLKGKLGVRGPYLKTLVFKNHFIKKIKTFRQIGEHLPQIETSMKPRAAQ